MVDTDRILTEILIFGHKSKLTIIQKVLSVIE